MLRNKLTKLIKEERWIKEDRIEREEIEKETLQKYFEYDFIYFRIQSIKGEQKWVSIAIECTNWSRKIARRSQNERDHN